MRFLAYSILGSAILMLGTSAHAQSGYKNTTNGWSMVSNVHGSHGELIGKIYAAPKSTLWSKNGKVSAGAGKFVSEKNEKEVGIEGFFNGIGLL